jgi:signal peptidase II
VEAGLKKILKNYGSLVLIVAVILVLDQWTKSLVLKNIPLNQMWRPGEWSISWFRFVFVQNTGVAFGMFKDQSTLFTILPFIVSALIIYYYTQIPNPDWALRLALSMQLGGAIGNLIDRLTLGYVVDFVSVGTFPVFNVADACITVGVGILLLDMFIEERREKMKAAQEAAAEDGQTEVAPDSASMDEAVSS